MIDKFVDVDQQFVDTCRKFNFPNLIIIKFELESHGVFTVVYLSVENTTVA